MKIIKIFSVLMAILMLCSCTANSTSEDTGKYANSKYTGVWYNADSADEKLVYELKADGTAIYEGTHKGVWEETDNGISITITKDKKEVKMTGYFVIAGDGFVARATEQNQHYLDEGKGELQLEIMLTKNTCVDCVKKDK
jgi:hypothetical protein